MSLHELAWEHCENIAVGIDIDILVAAEDDFAAAQQAFASNEARSSVTPVSDSVDAAIAQWIETEADKTNIENSSFTKSAIGVYEADDGTVYFTQLFTD